MNDIFARVDDALIDRLFQPLADWMARLLTLRPDRAARAGLDLATLAWIGAEAGAMAQAMRTHDVPSAFTRAALMIAGLWAFTIVRAVFQRAGGARQANPLRPGMQLHRVFCLLWILGLAAKAIAAPSGTEPLALLATGLFATASVYIGACTNPPPAWRKNLKTSFAFGQV